MTFEPSIVQSVAGVGEITFRYLSSDISGRTTAQLLPSFTVEEVCVQRIVYLLLYKFNIPCLHQINGSEVTLVHTSCLPGYFLRDGQCICEESNVVALCDSHKRGIILVVSCIILLFTVKYKI